ncbi:hypothetical protein ABZ023_30925 [Streptomyces sp. NPDC006367]|uniref:hypothetical protein n=1 Tax=unclassified Streptomyces TaxID=2593676 RepID=UPI0033BA2205
MIHPNNAADNRHFTFLANASVLVTITAPTQQEARAAYEELDQEEFAIGFTTVKGHVLNELALEDARPELYKVDGEELAEPCPRKGCDGHLVNDRCTEDGCPTHPHHA